MLLRSVRESSTTLCVNYNFASLIFDNDNDLLINLLSLLQ